MTPTDTIIAGLPVRSLDSTWTAVVLLRAALMPRDAAADSIRDNDFAIGGDFNNDGVRDSAVVGVYRTQSDGHGRFLLILTRTAGGWSKAFLSIEDNVSPYSSINWRLHQLSWFDCTACDYSVDYAWDGKKYALVQAAADSL